MYKDNDYVRVSTCPLLFLFSLITQEKFKI